MIESIKITSLNNIGSNLSFTSVFPVVNVNGTPITNKANLQIIGNYILSQAGGANFVQAAQATLAQSVVNSAQPNITSVGTLNINTLNISGGVNGYMLQTDGDGNLAWVAGGGSGNGEVGGSDKQVQFNDAGNFGGNNGFLFNKSTGNLTVPGNINSTGDVVLSAGLGNNDWHFTFGENGSFTTPSNVSFLGSRLNLGYGSQSVSLTNPTFVSTLTGGEFIQAALINQSQFGSSDWAAYGANATESGGWVDMGVTSYGFNDTDYTITNPGTGYVFAQGYANGIGGELVLATGDVGSNNDIIFATGGFLLDNEFARFDHANNTFHLTRTGSGIQFADGTIQTTAGGGGNANTGNITFNGSNISTNTSDDLNIIAGVDGNAVLLSNNHIFMTVDDTTDPHGGIEMTWSRTVDAVTSTAGISINTQYGNTELATGSVQIVAASNVANGLANSAWTFDSFNVFTAPGNADFNGNVITLGPGASELAAGLNNPTLVISDTGDAFIQAAINNVSDIGSADWVAYGHHGNDAGGWVDMGFTSSFFSDPDYTITGPGDGYVIVSGYLEGQAPAVGGGNLVLATNSTGLTKDIIFATGGFLAENEFARISDANNALELTKTGSLITFATGANTDGLNINGGTPSATVALRAFNANDDTVSIQAQGNSSSAVIEVYANATDTTYQWKFDATGNLTTPEGAGDITLSGGNILGANVVTANIFAGDVSLTNGGGIFSDNFTPGGSPGNTIILQPAGIGITTDQKLMVYPTAGDGDHIHLTSGNLYQTELFLGSDDLFVKLANTGNVVVNSNDSNGNSAQWVFDTTGQTIFPTLTVDLHNGGNQTAQTLQFGDANLQAIITGPTPNVDINAQRLIIQGQRGNGTGEGGDVYVWAGDADINGGDIKIYAGDADTVTTGYGGYINITGGDGFDGGGAITLTGGQSTNGIGASVGINGGYGATDGGPIYIRGGYAQNTNGGAVNITGGISGNGLGSYGNVNIGSGASEWIFDNTGNISAPGNFIVGGKQAFWTFSSSGLTVTANIQNDVNGISMEDGVDTYVYAGSNVVIESSSGNVNYDWTFANDGNLTLPGSIIFPDNSIYMSNGYVLSSTQDIGGQVDYANRTMGYSADNNGTAALYARDSAGLGNNNAVVSANGTNGKVTILAANTTTSQSWVFDGAGNLTLPGNTFSVNYANSTPVNPATKFESEWTVTAGTNNYSFTVPASNTYVMWIEGNIANGIIAWNATATVTNTNVPVLGQQFAWNYDGAGTPLGFTSLPNQFVGTAGVISNSSPSVSNTNTFTFGIDNTSGSDQTVRYGWTTVS